MYEAFKGQNHPVCSFGNDQSSLQLNFLLFPIQRQNFEEQRNKYLLHFLIKGNHEKSLINHEQLY